MQDFIASLYGAGRREQRAQAVSAKMPYAKDRDGHMIWGDDQMRNSLWLLPPQQDVVRSLAELLKNDDRFSQYEIIPLTGDENGSSISVQEKHVKKVIADNGVSNRDRKAGVIILTIGKLTMGATIPELGSVLMLADTESAMQYNQTTFRCKSAYRPGPTMGAWRKERGLVFDFKRDRAVSNLDAGFMSMLHMLSREERSEQRKRNAAAIPVITYDDKNNKFTRMDEQQRLKIFNGDFSKLGDVFSRGRAIEIADIESAIARNKSVFERADKAGGLAAELSWRMKLTDAISISGGSPSEAEDGDAAPDPSTTSAPDPTVTSPAQQNRSEAEEPEAEKAHDAASLVEAVQNMLKTVSERLPAMTLVTVARMPLASVDEADVTKSQQLWDIIPREVKTAFLGLRWTKPGNAPTLLDIIGVTQERCRLDEAISDVLSHARSTTDSMIRSLWHEAVDLVGRLSDQNSKPSDYIRNVSLFYSKNVKKFENNEIITPWNVVDMHLSTTIGGESWCDGSDVRTEAKHVDTSLTVGVYGSTSTDGNGDDHPKPMLDIGCKGGLYSLWLAQSEYARLIRRNSNPFNRDPDRQQWDKWDQAVSRVYTMAVNERGAMLAEALLNGPHRVGWRAMVTPIEVVSKKFGSLMKMGRMPKLAERNELMGLPKNTGDEKSKEKWKKKYSPAALKKNLLSMFTNDNHVDEYNRIMRSVAQFMTDRRGEWENMTVRQQMDAYDHIRSAVNELTNDPSCLSVPDDPSCLSDPRPFAVAVGNPPYQSDNNNNIYQYFVFTANDIADIVSMITKGDFYSTPNPKMPNEDKSSLMTIIRKHGLSFSMPDDPFNGLVGATGGIAMFSFDHESNGMPDFVEAYNHSDNPLRSLANTSSLAVSTRNPYGLVLTASELANTDPDCIPVYSKAGIGRKPLSAFDDYARKHLTQWAVAWGKANGASVNKRVFIGEPFLVRPGIALGETFLCYWLDSETDARHFQKYVKTRFFRSCIAAMNPGHNFSTMTYKYVPDFIKDVKDNIDWDQSLDDIDDQLCSYFNVDKSVLDAVVKFDTPMLTIEQYAF